MRARTVSGHEYLVFDEIFRKASKTRCAAAGCATQERGGQAANGLHGNRRRCRSARSERFYTALGRNPGKTRACQLWQMHEPIPRSGDPTPQISLTAVDSGEDGQGQLANDGLGGSRGLDGEAAGIRGCGRSFLGKTRAWQEQYKGESR